MSKEQRDVGGSLSRRDFLDAAAKKPLGTALGFSVLAQPTPETSSREMPTRVLGRTKLSVSLLGFGCTQVKDKAVYRRAVELGINYFHMGDRDPTYNLDACAALLPFRKKIAVAYMSFPKPSRTVLLQDLEKFLRQSRLGHLDVWFVMTPRQEVLEEFHEAVRIARKAGTIRWAGITTHSLDQDVVKLTVPESPIDVVMMTYNYLSPRGDTEKLGKLHDAGLGITPMKPLAGKFYEKATSRPDALLRWLAADRRIHSVPVIMNTIDQVEQNVAAVKRPLSEEDRKTLRAVFSYNSPRFCRMCGACDGKCPRGLPVSDLIRTAMYAEGYGDMRLARSTWLSIPKASRQISCAGCERCFVLCPNGVAVEERIRRIKEWFV